MTQNRKRGRNMCEDEVECTPLSKRINNLHINGNLMLENRGLAQPNTSQWTGSELPQQSPLHQDDTMGFNQPLTPTEPSPSMPSINFESTQYSPVLSEIENPHYFYKNKLLFEMHVERMQRTAPNF